MILGLGLGLGWGWGCQHERGTRIDEDILPDLALVVAIVADPPSVRLPFQLAAAGATVFCNHKR